ncbi:MAG: putative Ni/Fe-hydrogenase 2 b-type cytochrome subunit [Chloroflexi bacterium ADurb.Bin325]|nr:MAG: putative Ni/Fe-hydrogenase 2 b-type cytochrome subunit [Chloroflexi bacterium ADurb.Bin325]
MFQDILMLGALFILRIIVPLLLVIGIGYSLLRRLTGVKLDFSPKFVTGVGLVLSCWAIAAIALILRFTNGLGAITNLTDEFPLGLWIGFDVMAGAMLGGGAFVLAGLVYVFGIERYRPILRSTILTAFLGYALLIVALLIDVGRPQNILMLRPVFFFNIHSVLWEVAMCVMFYTTVLALEFLPALFERLRWKRAWQIVHKITLPLVIIGILLSTMHQSSLGSMWLIANGKLNDLWYTPWLPVFFWISAIGVGLGMVTVESNLSSRAFKRGLEQDLLASLAKFNSYWLGFYAIARLADVVWRGKAYMLTEPTLMTLLFWVEVGLGAIVPAILMSQPKIREHKNALYAIGAVIVVGGILNRLCVSMFGMWTYTGPVYLPSIMEVALTAALFTFGGAVFVLLSRLLPVFPKEETALTASGD